MSRLEKVALSAVSMVIIVGLVYVTALLLRLPPTTVAAWWSLLWIGGEIARREFR